MNAFKPRPRRRLRKGWNQESEETFGSKVVQVTSANNIVIANTYTGKQISLTRSQWDLLTLDRREEVTNLLKQPNTGKGEDWDVLVDQDPAGKNLFYANLWFSPDNKPYINLRFWFRRDEKLVPTKQGIYLTPVEWEHAIELVVYLVDDFEAHANNTSVSTCRQPLWCFWKANSNNCVDRGSTSPVASGENCAKRTYTPSSTPIGQQQPPRTRPAFPSGFPQPRPAAPEPSQIQQQQIPKVTPSRQRPLPMIALDNKDFPAAEFF